MALAPYFDKAALSAATLLRGFDRDAFAAALNAQLIEIAFDDCAVSSAEGRVALDLATNLLSRLYPRIRFAAQGTAARILPELIALAKAINPYLEFDDAEVPTVRMALGASIFGSDASPTVYVGSDGWIALVSTGGPVNVGQTANPFGAAAAACIGAANVFRIVFASQLTDPRPDQALRLSLLDLQPGAMDAMNPPLADVDIGIVHLVGAGAIGNGFVWALTRATTVRGELHVVDGEEVDETNPQRYVLTEAVDVGMPKVALSERVMHNGIRVVAHQHRWGCYLAMLAADGAPHRVNAQQWSFDRVAVALDTARDRIAVQAALPRIAFNAWTQAGDLGVSRHIFDDGPCVACLYIGGGRTKDEDQLVAEAIRLPERVRDVRRLLHLGGPVGREWIQQMAEALGVDPDEIMSFAERPLRAFYSEAICAGLVMRLQGKDASQSATEVPMAFQSALAGVLLAAYVVADAASVAAPILGKAVLDLLRPIGTHLIVPIAKHPGGRCICQDDAYLDAYRRRHAAAGA